MMRYKQRSLVDTFNPTSEILHFSNIQREVCNEKALINLVNAFGKVESFKSLIYFNLTLKLLKD